MSLNCELKKKYEVVAHALHAAIDLGLGKGAFSVGLERAGLPEAELDEGRARVIDELDVALFGAQVALEITSDVFCVTGTPGVTGNAPLDICRRDLRTHTLHDRSATKVLNQGRYVGLGGDIALIEKLS